VTPITIPINFSGNAISVLDLNSISHGDLVTPVTNLVTVVTGDADSTGVLGTVTGAVGGVTASVEGIISGDYNPIDVVTGIVGGVLSGEGGSPLDLVTGLVVVSVMVSHQAMVNITMVSAMVLRMTQTLSHPLQFPLTSLAMPFPYLVLQRQLQPIMQQRLHIITSRTMTPKIMARLAMDLVVSVMVLVQAMATITMVSAMALEMVPTS